MGDKTAVGAPFTLKVNGQMLRAVGNFTYNFGNVKRAVIKGAANEYQGYSSEPQVPFIEGALTDHGDIKAEDITNMTEGRATIDLANGKTGVWHNATYCGEGTIAHETGQIGFRIEAGSAEEIAPA